MKFLKPTTTEIEAIITNCESPFQFINYIWEHGFVMGIIVGYAAGIVAPLFFYWVTK